MKIIIDIREHDLYEKCENYIKTMSNSVNIHLSKEVLDIGDILFKTNDDLPVLLIERKSFSDLLASIKDGRYEEQSYRLFNSSGFPLHSVFYLLEGMFSQLKNPNDKKIIYSAMTSLQMFKGFSVHRTSSVNESAEWITLMADKLERDMLKGKTPYYLTHQFLNYDKSTFTQNVDTNPSPINELKTNNSPTTIMDSCTENILSNGQVDNYCSVVKKVKKDNITPENIGEIILCQIPGISSVTAIAIMKKFANFPAFMNELKENPNILENLSYESNGKTRKISKTCIESIRRFLL